MVYQSREPWHRFGVVYSWWEFSLKPLYARESTLLLITYPKKLLQKLLHGYGKQ